MTSTDNTLITDREQQVLHLLANGLTAKEIADNLYISTHTVHTHRKNLIIKYEAKNTVHMVVKAMRKNLFLSVLLLFFFQISQTQIHVEMESTNSGLVIPKMTSAQKEAISNPPDGLLVFDTDLDAIAFFDSNTGRWSYFMAVRANDDRVYYHDQKLWNGGHTLIGNSAGVNIDTAGGAWGNTFVGHGSGFMTSTGFANTALGIGSLENNKIGHSHVAIGTGAGHHQDNTYGNTFVGISSGHNLKRGNDNVALGAGALFQADTSWGNVAVGFEAMKNGQGQTHNNVVVGNGALRNFSKGWDNVVIGPFAGENADTLHGAVIIGHRAGHELNVDGGNVFIGNKAGENTISGIANTFIGSDSGSKNTSGVSNTFVGVNSGRVNTSGQQNTYVGLNTAFSNELGNRNTYLGDGAGFHSINGSESVLVGQLAAGTDTTVERSVYIGFEAGYGNGNLGVGPFHGKAGNVFVGYRAGKFETGSNKLIIENSDSSTPLIYGEFDNDKVQINGSMHITEFAKLTPGSAPSSPEEGTLYYDNSDKKVKVWTGAAWENLN